MNQHDIRQQEQSTSGSQCQRLVIRNLPFNTTELDFMAYIKERRSCSTFFANPATPSVILTSFKPGKAENVHKQRGPVCATAFLLTGKPFVASTIAASLDQIAFNPTSDPNLLMSVEYSAYQDAPVAAQESLPAAVTAGGIFTNPAYLAFAQNVESQRAGGATGSAQVAVTRESLEKYAEEAKVQLEARRQTTLVNDMVANWFNKVPFGWERRKLEKERSAHTPSSSSSKTSSTPPAYGGSAEGSKISAASSSAAKDAKALKREAKRDKERRRKDRRHREAAAALMAASGSPETSSKPVKDRKRGGRKRGKESSTGSSANAPISTAGDAAMKPVGDKKHRTRKEKKERRERREETSKLPDDAYPDHSAVKKSKRSRDRSSRHHGVVDEDDSQHQQKRASESSTTSTRRGSQQRSGNKDPNVVAAPKSRDQEILDRERDREARKRRVEAKEERKRRQDGLLREANQKHQQLRSETDGVSTSAAPASGGGGTKRNTFTVSNTRKAPHVDPSRLPSLDEAAPPRRVLNADGPWNASPDAATAAPTSVARRPEPKRVLQRPQTVAANSATAE